MWHKGLERYVDFCEYISKDGKPYELVHDEYESHLREIKDVVLMQFTGLFDKNGQEIYEGDIVRTSNDRVLEVSYNVPWTSFVLSNKYKKHELERLGNYATELLFEVIGNLYEHPELLG